MDVQTVNTANYGNVNVHIYGGGIGWRLLRDYMIGTRPDVTLFLNPNNPMSSENPSLLCTREDGKSRLQ
jgi:hypothetical protein